MLHLQPRNGTEFSRLRVKRCARQSKARNTPKTSGKKGCRLAGRLQRVVGRQGRTFAVERKVFDYEMVSLCVGWLHNIALVYNGTKGCAEGWNGRE